MSKISQITTITYVVFVWGVMIGYVYDQIIKKKRRKNKKDSFWENYSELRNKIEKYPYTKRNIKYQIRMESFLALKEWADKNDYYVFPMVHQNLLLIPGKEGDDLARFIGGWADYVICNKEFEVIAIINLTKEFNSKDMAIHDLTEKIYKDAGYKVISVVEVNDRIIEMISQ